MKLQYNKPPSFWTEYRKIVTAHFEPGNFDVKFMSMLFWIGLGGWYLLHSNGF